MADYDVLKRLALSCGFSNVGDLDVNTIEIRSEVRESCAENKCHAYRKNWACPPGCGTLEECSERIHRYKKGLILQSTGKLEDAMDYEAMMQLSDEHNKHMDMFFDKISSMCSKPMMIGAGACKRCKICTYPDAPCRFPDKMYSSMEALGMVVSNICEKNGIPYYYGVGTLTYVGCVLID